NLNSVSSNINPVFKIEQLFLRVLVEGDANLYAYKDTNLQRYFYSKEASEIKQLIYKMYKTVDNSVDSNKKRIAYNKKYKQQVRQELNCSPIKSSSIKKLTYQEASLFKYFVAYNECSGAPTKTYGDRQERGQFLLNIRPRINSSSLAVRAVGTNTFNTNFARETGFGLGIEGEFILPFNNQKWSLLIEPTYRKFAQEKIRTSNQVSGGTLQSTVTYNSVELPVGLRRYFFLGKRSTIFANISFYLADSPGTSSVDFRRSDQSIIHSLEVDVRNNLAFGLGYKFDRKFGLEVRFDTDREILMKWQSWRSSYQKVAVILSYTPF
ncbi:MAG: outer membrane beta-barrel protein, partial [Bacteroidota bacterium]